MPRFDIAKVPALWYENEEGEKWIPSPGEHFGAPPPGFIYQHSRFPCSLHHTVLQLVQADEVAACKHAGRYIRRTFDWVDGIEGRECANCGGTQTRKVRESWPAMWDAHGSRTIAHGETQWVPDLVLTMSRPRWWGFRRPDFTLPHAILVVATACERCLNVLLDRYGLGGYREGSEEWQRCSTRCHFCEDSSEAP